MKVRIKKNGRISEIWYWTHGNNDNGMYWCLWNLWKIFFSKARTQEKLETKWVNPFLANIPILYSLKTLEKQRFSGVFREYKMGTLAKKRVHMLDIVQKNLTHFSPIVKAQQRRRYNSLIFLRFLFTWANFSFYILISWWLKTKARFGFCCQLLLKLSKVRVRRNKKAWFRASFFYFQI